MTIQEAIKSGKRYRRAGCIDWVVIEARDSYVSESDILATDWEVETVRKDLSAEDIRMAANRVRIWNNSSEYSTDDLIKELGL